MGFPLCPSAPLPLCPSAPLPLCPSAPLSLSPLHTDFLSVEGSTFYNYKRLSTLLFKKYV